MSKAPILVVGGVTAAGKTGAALALARELGGELVGADSVQVYRGFDIGSAKPTKAELGAVRHHLLDVVEPTEELDASSYAELADRAIGEILERGRVPIIVGGSGLWLRALLFGLVKLPPPDPDLRARLNHEADEKGSEALHQRLRSVDPQAASQIHPNDRLRIVRALEVYEQTGVPLGEQWLEHRKGGPRYQLRAYCLDRPRPDLYEAIRARIEDMLARGWIAEVESLLARYGRDVRPLFSVGYRQILEHLEEGISLEETRRAIYRATRIYTRRQRTWFGADPVPWRQTTATALTQRELDAIGAWWDTVR